MSKLKPSREFEKLVAKVEKTLAGQNAVITSPDRIQDKDVATRHLREIDVSIRMMVGSAPVLVIIECRNRGRKQDVEWVEQVKAKRDGVGADKAVMVPSNGLTALAREKAAAYKIVVTRFNLITVNDVRGWFQAPGLTVRRFQGAVRNAEFIFRNALVESDRESFPQSARLQDKVLTSAATERSWSMEEILDVAFAKPSEDMQKLLSTLTVGGPSKVLNLRVTLSDVDGPFEFRIGETLREVREVRVLLDVSVLESQVQPFQVYAYGREESPALDVLDFRVPAVSGAEQTLSIRRNRETGIVSVEMGLPGAPPELLPEGVSAEERRSQVPTVPVPAESAGEEDPENS